MFVVLLVMAPSYLEVGASGKRGAVQVSAYDPEAMGQAAKHLEGVDFSEDPYSCAEGADALVILTEWDAFRALDLPRLKAIMAAPVIIDLRNIYRPALMRRLGFTYEGVGVRTASVSPALREVL